MKHYAFIALLMLAHCSYSQYYMRGTVQDDKGKPVTNVTVYIYSTKMYYNIGGSGSFGLMSAKPTVDTFAITADGYEKLIAPVYVNSINKITMRLLASVANAQKKRLASFTKDLKNDRTKNYTSSNETYSNLIENDFVQAANYPITGFAVNSDRASYSNVRRFINTKSKIPTDAVRIEEMINYFNFNNNININNNEIFGAQSYLAPCPWNTSNLLLYISIAAKKLDLDKLPCTNLVFLIDNSGSMELQNRMPLLKSAFKLLIQNLRAKDTISIVTYGGHVDVALPPISGYYKDSILAVIEAMEPAGDTPGESAIKIAYNIAKSKFNKNGNNRVILATDGDFNVGITDEAELEKMITLQSQSGIYLTCIGVGMGNYKDSKLEVLAKKGNGNFAYIDSETEAEKLLVKEFTQTLYSVADKTYMSITFQKQLVQEYRLIGFDNKLNALNDTTSKIDGGEVGSGYQSMVLFEIKPTALLLPKCTNEPLAAMYISYRNATTQLATTYTYNCVNNYVPFNQLPKCTQFATAIAWFGGYIKQSKYINNTNLDTIQALAALCIDDANTLQTEFYTLLDKAKKIYEPKKGKRIKSGY